MIARQGKSTPLTARLAAALEAAAVDARAQSPVVRSGGAGATESLRRITRSTT